jgi:hypothetical protein
MATVACYSSRDLDRRLSGRRLVAMFAPLVTVACGLGLNASAVAQTWTNGASTGLWSNSANWSATPGINRTFDDTAVGSSTADGNRTGLWALNVSNTTGTHQVNLDAGTLSFSGFPELNIGLSTRGSIEFSNGSITMATSGAQSMEIGRAVSAAADGTMAGTSTVQATLAAGGLSLIGHADGSFNATGVLDMANSNNGSLTLASLRAGWANSSGAASATMSFGNNWAFAIGSAGTRSDFNLGYASAGTGSGSFTAGTGGSFTAYASTFNVGSGGNVTTTRTGTMNLSGINGGLIDSSVASNRSFNIGRGVGSGSVSLGSNWTVNVNLAHTMLIGVDGGTGSLTGNNLTLQGSAGFLFLGSHDQATTTGTGTLDMGGGSFGTGFTVGTVRVGFGGSSTGTAKLGTGTFSLTGTADIGDAGASGVEGLVELDGTMFTAGTSAVVNVNNSGRLNILVSDASSGLILTRAAPAALTIADTVANGNGILATFQNNPTGYNFLGTSGDPIYWAIKWAGDRTTDLNGFLTAGRIAANTSGLTGGLAGATPQVIYNGTDTYYGIYVSAVPEPSTIALASCGLALAGWSLRRRARKA